MTHEFKNLLTTSEIWKNKGIRSVLATVVSLEGSSYRRPGVRMLISETGEMHGAVSGGCVEKEVLFQAESVFKTGIPKVMTYDGRFRLGCEGILYVLLEPFEPGSKLTELLKNAFTDRKTFQIQSFFKAEFSEDHRYGSFAELDGVTYPFRSSLTKNESSDLKVFEQNLKSIFQLYIFGAEHDAVQLCEISSKMGWEVHIIAAPDEQKTIEYFQGATSLTTPLMDSIDVSNIGENTAVVLMSHSLNKDVQYLLALRNTKPAYLGLLGPSKRREKLLNELLNYFPDTDEDFFDRIYGPTGLDIGAESASEIAVSIVAEILSVTRNSELKPLKDKSGNIHS